ncbi:hypothetical protein LCGC14_2380480, partial [marine sediment metagenome]
LIPTHLTPDTYTLPNQVIRRYTQENIKTTRVLDTGAPDATMATIASPERLQTRRG